LITGYMDGVHVSQTEGAVFAAMLQKPVTIDDLNRAIQAIRGDGWKRNGGSAAG
jgi:hypothetical protein